MRHFLNWLVVCVLVMPALTAHAAADKRVALVIGNAAYPSSPLKNPVNDARAISTKLKSLGFEVVLRENLTQKQIGGTLREFRSKLAPGSEALFFYAGHGLQVKGVNYLPAVDADISAEEDVPTQSIDVNKVLEVMEENKTRLNLVFLDACRNNPFSRGFRSAGGGLAKVAAPSGTKISFATRPGSVAADGEGDNGLYTEHLLLAMSEKGIPIEQALKNVYAGVKKASKGKQEPWSEGEIEGNFYFIFQGPATVNVQQAAQPATAPVRIQSAAEVEQELWDSIKDANNIDVFNEYLKVYPKGRFASQARIHLTRLKKEAAPATPAKSEPVSVSHRSDNAEDALWNAVEKGGSADDYDAYLTQHPKGKYTALAKSRKTKLQDQAAQEAHQREAEAWATAESGNSEDSYSAYLKAYPTGQYAQLAKNRQKKLAEDKEAREEQENWKQAEAATNKSAVQSYLSRHPAGRHAGAARQKLAQIEREEAEMKPGKVFRDCPECPEMVILPAGNFDMGSPSSEAGRLDFEGPVHQVSVKPFALGKFEVTRGQFAAFVSATGHNADNECYTFEGGKWEKRSGRNWQNPGYPQNDNHPVVCVGWEDAKAYVAWLSRKTGKTYRLPTEAEWEYAARAGTTTARYWGDSPDQACSNANVGDPMTKNQVPGWNFPMHNCNDGHAYTAGIGSFKPNAFGLYDMIGNAWEWTEDCWNKNHVGAPVDGSAWTTGECTVGRVLRGGSWSSGPQNARAANRSWLVTSIRSNFIHGFRLARMLP